jgi:diadenylate cyclase
VDILLSAVQQLSSRRRGALIVIPRRVGIRNIVQTGTRLDAEVSINLLSTIFFEGTALHDGAVILEGDRVVAAGGVLPLSEREDVESAFGARHRAALGMVEETDAVVLVVSEENGAVSLARDGDIRYNITIAEVEAELKAVLDPQARGPVGREELGREGGAETREEAPR